MTNSSESSRRVAACEHCGSIFAAYQRDDGRLRPIGRPQNCPCGEADFRLVE